MSQEKKETLKKNEKQKDLAALMRGLNPYRVVLQDATSLLILTNPLIREFLPHDFDQQASLNRDYLQAKVQEELRDIHRFGSSGLSLVGEEDIENNYQTMRWMIALGVVASVVESLDLSVYYNTFCALSSENRLDIASQIGSNPSPNSWQEILKQFEPRLIFHGNRVRENHIRKQKTTFITPPVIDRVKVRARQTDIPLEQIKPVCALYERLHLSGIDNGTAAKLVKDFNVYVQEIIPTFWQDQAGTFYNTSQSVDVRNNWIRRWTNEYGETAKTFPFMVENLLGGGEQILQFAAILAEDILAEKEMGWSAYFKELGVKAEDANVLTKYITNMANPLYQPTTSEARASVKNIISTAVELKNKVDFEKDNPAKYPTLLRDLFREITPDCSGVYNKELQNAWKWVLDNFTNKMMDLQQKQNRSLDENLALAVVPYLVGPINQVYSTYLELGKK